MATITQVLHFNTTPENIYEIYTHGKRHSRLINAPARIDRSVGGKFSFWDGGITGKITQLIPNEKIGQLWRSSEWKEGHYSTVTITLEHHAKGTELTLVQENVPDDDVKNIERGWNDYYWKPLEHYLK